MTHPNNPNGSIKVDIQDSGKVRIEYADGHIGYLEIDESIELCRTLFWAIIGYSSTGGNKDIVEKCEYI